MSELSNRASGGTEGGDKPSSIIQKTDLVVTAVILAICGFLYWQTTIFAAPPSMLGDYMLPQDFPRLLICSIALLSLLLPVEQGLFAKKDGSAEEETEPPLQVIAYTTTAFMIATVFVMPWLGTLITVFLISAVMPLMWGERRKVALVLFAILTPLSIYILFEVFFRVRLIPGLLRPLYY